MKTEADIYSIMPSSLMIENVYNPADSTIATQKRFEKSIIGVWPCVTTFLEGPRVGQSQNIEFEFFENGIMLARAKEAVGLTQGVWVSQPGGITYTFIEHIAAPHFHGYLWASHQVVNLHENHFLSFGKGFAFSLEGKPMFSVKTRTEKRSLANIDL